LGASEYIRLDGGNEERDKIGSDACRRLPDGLLYGRTDVLDRDGAHVADHGDVVGHLALAAGRLARRQQPSAARGGATLLDNAPSPHILTA
jgi:hypothetical protein